MLTGGPLCRESHTVCRLKNHTVIQIGYLQAFILQPGVYNVHRLCPPRKFRRNGRNKERKKGSIVHHCLSFVTRGVQLILADSWARPAILVAGKGREVMFLFLLFLHFHSCFSFFPVPPFHLFCYLFCLFSPFLWETTQNDPQGLTCR